MRDQIERRFQAVELLAEAGGEGNERAIVGYAAVFNSRSEDLGGFVEVIQRGAFAGAQEGDVRALFNHDANMVLGRTKAGTLAVSEDEIGLRIRITPPDTQYARDLIHLIERGDVSQMSFGFRTILDSWDTVGEETVRTLKQVALYDVSPVTFPAYAATSVQMRAMMNVPEVPAGVRGATAPAFDEGQLRAQAAMRQREIEILTA